MKIIYVVICLVLLFVSNNTALAQTNNSNTQTSGEKVYTNKEVDHRATILTRPDAEYTKQACKKGVIGLVLLQAILTSKGKVESIEVLNGLPEGLSESAIKANKIKFKPAEKDGKPVSVRVKLEYNFFSEGLPPHCGNG